VDATTNLKTISIPTSLAPTDAALVELDVFASEASVQPIEEVWPQRGRRDELEALGLLLGVLSILLALAIGLGVTPGF
jgi:hypothetical protein